MLAHDRLKSVVFRVFDKLQLLLGDNRLSAVHRWVPWLAGNWLLGFPGASPAANQDAVLFDEEFYSARYPDARGSGMPAWKHFLVFGARKGYSPHPLFDTAFYLDRNPDVASSHLNPLTHFNLYGFKEGRSPSPLFDLRFYRDKYFEADRADVNPLIHYLSKGCREGAFPNPMFDTVFYQREYPDSVAAAKDPLSHYVLEGAESNYRPNPVFDSAYYRRRYPGVGDRGIDPLCHYLTEGGFQGCNPSPLFDSSYYLAQKPEAAAALINPLAHYLYQEGWRDADPHPLFDTSFYLNQYPDVPGSGIAPLVDFLRRGWEEERCPNPLLDTKFYLERYPAHSNPLIDFIENGAFEGRKPNPLFDPEYYLESYPEVSATGWNPLDHYIRKGAHHGYNPSPEFDSSYYLKQNPDVAAASINPLAHFLWIGREQGRLPKPASPGTAGRSDDSACATSPGIESCSSRGPLISVVLPVFNTNLRFLRSAIESVWLQTYQNWELCIVDDASTAPEVAHLLKELVYCDSKAKVLCHPRNKGVSAASNAALFMAKGDYVLFLDHDDELAPSAMQQVARTLKESPHADVVYSDLETIGAEGLAEWTYHKPDWSPAFSLGVMYVGHMLVVRRRLALAVGGFDSRYNGVQDYELLLRLTERSPEILHIRENLYRWRRTEGTMTGGAQDGSWFHDLHRAAVDEHLRRHSIAATAVASTVPGPFVTLAPEQRDHWPAITLLSEGENQDGSLLECLAEDYAPGSLSVQTSVSSISTDFTLVCGSGIGIESKDFLQHLLLYAQQVDVACVSPLILNAHGLVHNAGLIYDQQFLLRYSFAGWSRKFAGYAGELCCAREVSLISGHCYLIRTAILKELGGFGKRFQSEICRGIDLSMRARAIGYRNILTPAAAARSFIDAVSAAQLASDILFLQDACRDRFGPADSFSHAGFRHPSHIPILQAVETQRIERSLRP